MSNKASESSDDEVKKFKSFLTTPFNNDNLWITILIVYFIAVIVGCFYFPYIGKLSNLVFIFKFPIIVSIFWILISLPLIKSLVVYADSRYQRTYRLPLVSTATPDGEENSLNDDPLFLVILTFYNLYSSFGIFIFSIQLNSI